MSSATARPVRFPTSNRYEFQRPIGSGGMGTVYRALDRRTGEQVAIKVLKSKLSENPTLHHRLAREFRAATELEHPNIVRALEFENDGETSFLVFELVEGSSLGARIEQCGRLPEAESVRIVTQVAQALHYAHERQVIHRDVKPDNILILPDGRAKLTDFGLAKDQNDRQDLTRHASGLGTPHFMAPEQFADAKTAGPRCDIYSLGATLYNAITGRLPFDAKTPLAILTKKEMCQLRSIRSLAPGVSDRVEAAIKASVDPDPNRRPATCLDFFKALTARRRFKDDMTRTPAVGTPLPARVAAPDDRRAWVRHPVGAGSCATVSTAIHFGGGEETWPLVVRDLSVAGIGVLLARRFEAGTELTIELSTGPAGLPSRLPARVVRVQPDRAGHWIHGCTFVTPLTDEELAVLVKYA